MGIHEPEATGTVVCDESIHIADSFVIMRVAGCMDLGAKNTTMNIHIYPYLYMYLWHS